MNIGNLNRRIDVLEQKVVRDEYGGQQISWVPVARLWANIHPISGTEYFSSQQVTSEENVTITIRYNSHITVLNRIRYFDKIYEIIGVSDQDSGHKVTVINCKEKVSDELQRKAKESSYRN